jgi:periplasmic divalent cation tolerance protein
LDSDYLQVFTTAQKKEDAEAIAKTLVEKRLAGCVQLVGPITSTYWWNGAIETAEEWLCVIKSERSVYPELEETIRKIHTYEIPEITAISITTGSKDYLRWLGTVIGKKS